MCSKKVNISLIKSPYHSESLLMQRILIFHTVRGKFFITFFSSTLYPGSKGSDKEHITTLIYQGIQRCSFLFVEPFNTYGNTTGEGEKVFFLDVVYDKIFTNIVQGSKLHTIGRKMMSLKRISI